MMRDCDGFELCRQVRRNKMLAVAHIIFVTGKTLPGAWRAANGVRSSGL